MRPTIGAPAPPVELLTTDGDAWTLHDHLGTSVLLVFHRHLH